MKKLFIGDFKNERKGVNMKCAVVVGGGIVGLFSAIKLKEYVESVYIIEKEEKCGGLLRSFKNNEGVYFDMGTHIPTEILVKEVDDILFEGMDNGNWNTIQDLELGNVFCGKLYDQSSFVYTPYMSEDKYTKGLAQLLSCTEDGVDSSNLFTYSNGYFGETFTNEIYTPLMKKLLGKELKVLHPSAIDIFNYARLIPGDEKMSRELKKSSIYDKKLAFSSFKEGAATNRKFYPKNRNGVELWVNQLVDQAKQKGVKFLTGTTINSVGYENTKLSQISLEDGTTITLDLLVWTTAPAILLKLADIQVNSPPPTFRKMTLHNYVFDRPFLTDNHYIYCSDEHIDAFRVTLYPNIHPSNGQKPPYNCTVEVLTDQDVDVTIINGKVIEELKEMKIVSGNAEVLYKDFIEIKNGFPIVTNDFIEAVQHQKEMVNQHLKNVLLVGKASGEVFFINEAVIDAYQKIEVIFKRKENSQHD